MQTTSDFLFPFVNLKLTTIFYGKFDTVVDLIVWFQIAQILQNIIIQADSKTIKKRFARKCNLLEKITCFERNL